MVGFYLVLIMVVRAGASDLLSFHALSSTMLIEFRFFFFFLMFPPVVAIYGPPPVYSCGRAPLPSSLTYFYSLAMHRALNILAGRHTNETKHEVSSPAEEMSGIR